MNNFCKRFLFLICVFFAGFAAASTSFLIKDVEQRALEKSSALLSRQYETQAAKFQTSSAGAGRLPQVSIDGTYKYLSVLPQPAFAPPSTEFGSHHNYGIGLVVNQVLWDQHALDRTKQSLSSMVDSKSALQDVARRQLLLEVRSTYIKLLLSMGHLSVLEESQALAKKQFKDVGQRFDVGAASKMDVLNAKQELSRLESKKLEAWTAIQEQWIHLCSLTGDLEKDSSRNRIEKDQIELTGFEEIISTLQAENAGTPSVETHPQLLSLDKQAQSLSLEAKSQNSKLWPQLNAYFKTSFEYPNGPEITQIWQNTIGVTLSMPVLDWGKIRDLQHQKEAQSQAVLAQKKSSQTELTQDIEKALMDLSQSKNKIDVATQTKETLEEVAKLTEKAYQAGKLPFTEVLSANLKTFEAKIDLLRLLGLNAISWASYRALLGEKEKSNS